MTRRTQERLSRPKQKTQSTEEMITSRGTDKCALLPQSELAPQQSFLSYQYFLQPSKDFTGRPAPGSFCPEEVPSGKSQIAERRQRRKATPNYATAARALGASSRSSNAQLPHRPSPRSRGEPGRGGGGPPARQGGEARTGSCCHSTAPPRPSLPGRQAEEARPPSAAQCHPPP